MTCHEPMGNLYVDGVGWVEDGYTGGVFQLISIDGEYDIIWTDAFGTFSAKADGARIKKTCQRPPSRPSKMEGYYARKRAEREAHADSQGSDT